MYYDFFGFREPPFSIAPDPRYLYLSERHKEALAHLMYGVKGQGGFIVITGEVGTGKTTVSRCFIENVPDHVDIALILNPKLSSRELLSSICDELGIGHPAGASIKRMIDLINAHLLEAHAAGRHKVLMIDEAQNLSADVLEQLRLLTNLETAEKKLLQIVLLGQPELQEMLAQPELRQLSQRVTARYHLDAIERNELPAYLSYRLSVAGQRTEFFSPGAVKTLFRRSGGVPRLINLISDRAFLGAYAEGLHHVDARHIKNAAKEVLGGTKSREVKPLASQKLLIATVIVSLAVAVVLTIGLFQKGPVNFGNEIPVLAGTVQRTENAPVVPSVESEPVTDQSVEPENTQEEPEETQAPQDTQATPPDTTAEPEQNLSFSVENDGVSLSDGFQSLFGVWGINYQPAENPVACDFAESTGLRCLHRQGNWRSLQQINHPVILELRDDGGEQRFVTVISLAGDRATIASETGPREVLLAELERHWFGAYSLVWRLPPYLRSDNTAATGADRELWLNAQLMQLVRRFASDSDERQSLEAMPLDQQIRWYQKEKGLEADGIAGAMTLIQLNNDLNSGVPNLIADGDAS
ncbi:MAG: AAA family ATPase [Marinobacter sp.]|uniref:AAA family ATPase n=1 Tax=Marinobacter sp. TaxID=50741 RepID=UPI00349FE100